MEIPQYGEPEAAETVEDKPEVNEEAEIDLNLSKTEMQTHIQEYQDKCASLEQLVDEAAEAEDYEKAEELQEQLDKHIESNQKYIEAFQQKVDKMGDDDHLPEEKPEEKEEQTQVLEEPKENYDEQKILKEIKDDAD